MKAVIQSPKSEVRSPKSERNPKPEIPNRYPRISRIIANLMSQAGDDPRSLFQFRISNFFRISGFGFRVSRLAIAAVLLVAAARAWAADAPSVQLYDTRASARAPLAAEALAKSSKWTLVPEDVTNHKFKGDVVLSNHKLAVVLRQKGRGAEVYAYSAKGPALRAELVGVADTPATALAGIKIIENNPGVVSLEATFKTAGRKSLTVAYELGAGQIFVKTEPRDGATALRVAAGCRFAVMPDFFADDLVVDASELRVTETELPTDNFLMHLVGNGDAIVMPVWQPAKGDVRIALSGAGASRAIESSEIAYGNESKIFLAVIEAPAAWHLRDITRQEAGRILRLDWKAPFTAHWRVDWRRDDKLTDSWEMLTQKPSGEYVKHGWYGQPESFGNIDWLKEDRERWTTVLGKFLYPCWVDKNGAGFLQPLSNKVHFVGPALAYPITRLENTPLESFTVADVIRATLGVGPCEYILDVEGQKKTFQGRPTCASRTILNDIYSHKEQKQKKDQVRKTLDEVIAFVRHIRGRIEEYVTFSHSMTAYLQDQKKTCPNLTDTIENLEQTSRRIDGYVAQRKAKIKTPDYATALVEDFRTHLLGQEGDDALKECKRITAALVDIGGNQDELVGECRMVIKTLRQQVALAAAADPRVAPLAGEVRRRTQQMLRNPTSYEAPRH